MYLPGSSSQGLTSTHWHRSRRTICQRHASTVTRSFSQQQKQQGQQQQQQQQQEQQQQLTQLQAPVHPPAPPKQQQAFEDPRLRWARPEWVKPVARPTSLTPPPSPAAAAAGLRPGSSIQSSVAALQRRQRLLNKVTYGSYSSGDDSSEDTAANSGEQQQQQVELFQAMGIDFGAHRVGIAVRRSSHNVPLLTLHRQQDTGSSNNKQVQQQRKRAPARSGNDSRGTAHRQTVLPLQRTAAVVLHLALQEGCDGFIIGLPVFTDLTEPGAAAAAAAAAAAKRRIARRPGAAAGAAAAARPGDGRWINAAIRGFAQTLADLAAPLELPVLLVNEQQSSKQARAVMAGAAAYDVKSQAELDAEQLAARAGQQRQPCQQMSKQQRHELQKQQHALGRDAFAAALILSRYYNGLVQPVEQLQGSCSSSADESIRSDSSSSSQQHSWASQQVQQQAEADLAWMLFSPKVQRRRREQREQLTAAAAAAVQQQHVTLE